MKQKRNLALLLSTVFLGVSCGVDESSNLDIINGTPLEAENSGFTNLGNCSGTLIDNQWLLTAEHCINDSKLENGSLVSVRMGTQTALGQKVLAHPAWDVALVKLDRKLSMNGNSTTYEMPINSFVPSSLNGKYLNCNGYGNNTFTSGFGTLRTAILKVRSTTDSSHILEKNSDGQIQWKGDSGSSCLANIPGESQAITGVASTCSYSGTTVNSCNFVISTKFREWALSNKLSENFGNAIVTGDFDKDGIDDVAVGASGENGSGRVFIYKVQGDQFVKQRVLDQSSLDSNESGDLFGASLAAGDFNKDGFVDLAVGAPGETITGTARSGAIYIFTGSALGVSPYKKLTQSGLGADEGGDQFGHVLASGDFNKDGYADLAVGAPGEKPGDGERSGYVFLFKGSASSLLSPWQGLDQAGIGSNEAYDLFGHSLAVGDFNRDGYDDLAVGAPGEAPGDSPVSGYVFIFSGSASKLVASQGIGQEGLGVNERGDLFSWALSSGDYNNDGFDDLAVGAPGESPGDNPMSGYVFIFKGTTTKLTPWQGLDQKSLGANEIGDWFGASLASGDFNGDGKDDLAVGAPGEAPGDAPEAGNFFLFKGASTGVLPVAGYGQAGLGADEKGDWFAGSIAFGKFNNDRYKDLMVGAPGEAPGSSPRWGHAFSFRANATKLEPWSGISK